jgi:hypothetical protein
MSRRVSTVFVAALAACVSVTVGGAARGNTLPTAGSVVATIHVPDAPMGLLVIPGSVWATAHRSVFVYRINTSTNKATSKIKVSGISGGQPAFMVYTGTRVIDVNYSFRSIAIIDPRTNKAKIVNVRFENCCTPVFAGGSLWALGYTSLQFQSANRLSRIDPLTGRVTATLAIPAADGVVYGAGSLWVTSSNEMLRLDPRSGKIVGRFPVASGTTPFVFADGSLWALQTDEINVKATVVRIDPDTGSIIASIGFPDLVSVVTAAPDGTIWAAENSGLPHPHLWTIDPATNTTSGQVDLGNVTSSIQDLKVAADGTVWVSLFDANLVLRIQPN